MATCSSYVSAFPSTVDEKPHWGERQSCSSGTKRLASSMRRFSSSLDSSAPALRRHEPEHDLLSLRHEPQRLEAARALVVVLEEEAVHLEVAEERLGDEVVASLGGPRGAEVAAAQVRRHGHALGAAGERLVDRAGCRQRADDRDLLRFRRRTRAAAGRSGRRGSCRRTGGTCSRALPSRRTSSA